MPDQSRLRAVRFAVAGALAVTLLIVLLAGSPQSAQAAFTVPHCGGAPIQGQGSSLQKEAQLEFWSTTIFHGTSGCGAGAPSVKYEPDGSGCGIASIGGAAASTNCLEFSAAESGPGFRAPTSRFGGSDAPLSEEQRINADAAGGPKPGHIHQIPVASAAVAVVVHFPEGCKIKSPGTGSAKGGVGSENGDSSTGGPNDPEGAPTGDSAEQETLRAHISAEELEKIWDGTAQTWGNIVPEADLESDGKAAKPLTAEECAKEPVIRIVRHDGSGTTYNFKKFLSLLPGAPAGLWTSAPVAGDNNVWPITFGGEKKAPAEVNANVCEAAEHICMPHGNGGGEVAAAVKATSGSIGYLDLATARQKGFFMEAKTDDHTYWVPLQTVSPEEGNAIGAAYVEPTETPTSNTSSTPSGANCTGADYRGFPAASAEQPDPTLGNWEGAIATGGTAAAIKSAPTTAYPLCALTYDFAFDDDASVFGNSQLEQERARTVKDYLEAVESSLSQFHLALHDYGTLPLNVIEMARKGVEAIGWEKESGSGKGSEEVLKKPEEKSKGGEGGKVTPPSNSFSITSAKVKHRKILVSLELPGAGEVKVKATGGGVTVASRSGRVSGGQGTVTLSVSKAALIKLEKIKGHKMKVTITVTFIPTGGSAATHTKRLTITAAELGVKAIKGHRKGKK